MASEYLIQALACTTRAISDPVISEWPGVIFTNGYQLTSSLYLKSFSGFPEHIHKLRFINAGHKAYLTPHSSYLKPVSSIHNHIHLTNLVSYVFPKMKTMKWYDLTNLL